MKPRSGLSWFKRKTRNYETRPAFMNGGKCGPMIAVSLRNLSPVWHSRTFWLDRPNQAWKDEASYISDKELKKAWEGLFCQDTPFTEEQLQMLHRFRRLLVARGITVSRPIPESQDPELEQLEAS